MKDKQCNTKTRMDKNWKKRERDKILTALGVKQEAGLVCMCAFDRLFQFHFAFIFA